MIDGTFVTHVSGYEDAGTQTEKTGYRENQTPAWRTDPVCQSGHTERIHWLGAMIMLSSVRGEWHCCVSTQGRLSSYNTEFTDEEVRQTLARLKQCHL